MIAHIVANKAAATLGLLPAVPDLSAIMSFFADSLFRVLIPY
jgi:hypothetical protein